MKNRAKVSWGVLVMVMALLISGHHCRWYAIHSLETVSSCILYPFLCAQRACIIPLWNWYAKHETIAIMEKKLADMTTERDALRAQLVALQGTMHYEHLTKYEVACNQQYAGNRGVVAQILVRHISDNAHFFLADAGSRQGITKDMVALCNNCLIGRVDEVYPWYCKICLITDAACSVAAYCATTGAHGIHQGSNKKNTDLNYVSHLEQIHAGDMILSNGDGLVFPAGFALGVVASVTRGDVFYTITVTPSVDIASVNYCLIVSKNDVR